MSAAHILVVEDEAIVARNIQLELCDMGYVVPAIASSGAEALEMADEIHPDLVLMDVILKGELDGIETVRELRKSHDFPVVYLTAYADDETLERAQETQPHGYLVKPYEERELRSTIQVALYNHKVERMWREAHGWLASIVRCLGDAVLVTDAKGGIQIVNATAEELSGWSEEESVGKDLVDVLHLVDQKRPCSREIATAKAMQRGHAVRFDCAYVLLRKDGTRIPVEGCVTAIYDSQETVSGFVVVFRERQEPACPRADGGPIELQFQRWHRNGAFGRLADGLAHDFNQLLTVILGNTSLVLSSLPPQDPSRGYLTTLEGVAAGSGEIVKRLVNLCKGTAPQLERMDVHEAVQEVVEALCGFLNPRISVEFFPGTGLRSVLADRLLLREVLFNLCLNARDAMPDGGRLILETENVLIEQDFCRGHGHARPGGFVRLLVRDTGHGMPAEIQSRMFEPFFTTKEAGKGTGLGLAFVADVVELHGGWIDCTSAVNEGTCFALYVPHVETASAALSSVAGP